MPDKIDPNFPLWCVEEDDGSLTIHWDDKHPTTSLFNDWTEGMFVDMLLARAREVLA